MATPIKFTNNAHGSLNASINDSVTTITLVSGDGAKFPSLTGSEYFYATLIKSNNDIEIVKVTARSTDELTVVRNQEGSGNKAFDAGDRIELRITAQGIADISNINNNLPAQSANKFLKTDGSSTSWTTGLPALKADTLYNNSGDGDSGVNLATNDTVKLDIAGATKWTLDASGNNTATGAITAVGAILGASLGIENSSNDWTLEVDSNNLLFKYGGTSKMKLESNGNLTVVGNVTAYGSL